MAVSFMVPLEVLTCECWTQFKIMYQHRQKLSMQYCLKLSSTGHVCQSRG